MNSVPAKMADLATPLHYLAPYTPLLLTRSHIQEVEEFDVNERKMWRTKFAAVDEKL